MKIQDQPATTSHQIHTYTELKQQIHEDLRVQHPEWIEPIGDCPECDEHETRFRELLDSLTRNGSDESPLLRGDKGVEPQMESAAGAKSQGCTRPHSASNPP